MVEVIGRGDGVVGRGWDEGERGGLWARFERGLSFGRRARRRQGEETNRGQVLETSARRRDSDK